MSKEEITILTDLMRSFINESEIFNNSKIASCIGMKRNNFHLWLTHDRPLPKDYVQLLENLLKKYGFMSNM